MNYETLLCPNCKSPLLDDKQVICLKCGKRTKILNQSSDKKYNGKISVDKKKQIVLKKTNLSKKIFQKIFSFIFLIITIVFAYIYTCNQNLLVEVLKSYVAPKSLNIFNNLLIISHKAALNKDKEVYSFLIKQMNMEVKSEFFDKSKLYPLDFKITKNEINADNKIKMTLNLKNSSPIELKLRDDFFYVRIGKGIYFSKVDKKTDDQFNVNMQPWKSIDFVFDFNFLHLKKNNFLRGKIVFNNTNKYAINNFNLIFKDKF